MNERSVRSVVANSCVFASEERGTASVSSIKRHRRRTDSPLFSCRLSFRPSWPRDALLRSRKRLTFRLPRCCIEFLIVDRRVSLLLFCRGFRNVPTAFDRHRLDEQWKMRFRFREFYTRYTRAWFTIWKKLYTIPFHHQVINIGRTRFWKLGNVLQFVTMIKYRDIRDERVVVQWW